MTKRLKQANNSHSFTDVPVSLQLDPNMQQNWLAAIVESSSDAIISETPEGIILTWNRGAEELYGYNSNEAIGKSISMVIPIERSAEKEYIRTRVRRGEKVNNFETVRQRKDGSLVEVSLTVSPISDREGNITGISMIARDITSQKQAQEALHKSERFNRAVLDSVLSHIAVLDKNGTIMAVNEAWRCFGRENGNKLLQSFDVGANYLQVCLSASGPFAEEAQAAHDGIQSVLKAEKSSFILEYPCHAPAAERWFLMKVAPLAGQEGGEEGGAVVSHTEITEHKRIEQELQAERDFGTAVLDTVGSLVGVIDRQGRIVRFNRACEALTGYSFAEVQNRYYADLLLTEEEAAGVKAVIDDVSAGHFPNTHENYWVTKAGELRLISWTNTALLDSEGDVAYVIAAGQDITQQRQTETELHQAHAELEARVQKRTMELEQSNKSLREQIIERHLMMGALREAVDQLEEARQAAELVNVELRAKEERLLQNNRVITDLTSLRATSERALKKALAEITEAGTSLLDVERCSVWLFNEAQTCIHCHDLYDQSMQRHLQGIELSVEAYPSYFRVLRSRRSIVADDAHTHPATHEFSQGYLTPQNISSMLDVPIIIDGKMTGVLCFEHVGPARHWQVGEHTFATSAAAACSLTLESFERAKAENALRTAKETAESALAAVEATHIEAEKARAEAEAAREEAETAREEAVRANHAKSEFLSRMSHELRTPMNSILGFAQLMEMSAGNEKEAERAGYILKSGQHLLKLINEVLDIARVESGNLSLSPEPVHLNSTLQIGMDIIRPLCEQRELQLIFEQEPGTDLYVRADQQRLSQVFINLLSNAVKYNRAGGQVRVYCEPVENGKVRVNISDTGCGLTASQLSRLFQPFERLGAERSNIEGTGLGLSLTKHLVEAMGGSIGVQSTPETGSTFSIELNLTDDPIKKAEDGVASTPPITGLNKEQTILYVEDNLTNLRVIQHILSDYPNIHLVSAMQGGIGLELAREHQPSLILLDLHLPDIQGPEVLRRLIADPTTCNTPVVVISADATPNQIRRLMLSGATEYLTKPIDVKRFLEVMDDLLG
jgi:PAS domain S-box-containing protein